MLFKKILYLSIAITLSNNAIANNNATSTPINKNSIHLMKHSKCRYRKKDRVTYCVDKNNTKITGEIRRYVSGRVTLSIPLKNGLIEGVAKSYEIDGNKIYEKPYINGKVHGNVITYFPDNKIDSIIPYEKGKKEGVAKYYYPNGYLHVQCTYVDDTLDGQMRVYTDEGKMLYELVTANEKYVIGTCNYIDDKGEIKKQEVPQILLDAINANCVTTGTKLQKNCCSYNKSDTLENCNQAWLKENIKELRAYVNSCPIIQEEQQDDK